jgi:hypothetical protein
MLATAIDRWWRRITHGPRTNCLFFAVALYCRRFKFGRRQRIRFRKSHSGWFPHFLYAELRRGKVRLISYKPPHPVDRKCPPILFRGGVRWGDAPHIEINER